MKGADDMIGLVLGAVLGSGLYGAEKSMQIDSRTRKRYAKAFCDGARSSQAGGKQRSRQQIML